MMYVVSANMIEKLANRVYQEADLVAAAGIGLTIGYLISLTICIAHLN